MRKAVDCIAPIFIIFMLKIVFFPFHILESLWNYLIRDTILPVSHEISRRQKQNEQKPFQAHHSDLIIELILPHSWIQLRNTIPIHTFLVYHVLSLLTITDLNLMRYTPDRICKWMATRLTIDNDVDLVCTHILVSMSRLHWKSSVDSTFSGLDFHWKGEGQREQIEKCRNLGFESECYVYFKK